MLDTFSVSFDYNNAHRMNVDSWLRFAVLRDVKELRLLFHGVQHSRYQVRYSLPRFLFENETITRLDLKQCSFGLLSRGGGGGGGEIRWTSLRSLRVSYCILDNGVMEKLLAGCPVLLYLELKECSGLDKVDIVSVSLKELVISGYLGHGSDHQLDFDDALRISASNLLSLAIRGNMGYQKCYLEGLSSLSEARFDFEHDDDERIDSEWHYRRVKEMLTSVGHVKKLTLGTYCLQVISQQDAKLPPFLLLKCKSLILETSVSKWEVPGLASILRSCPELETLTIYMMEFVDAQFCVSSYYKFMVAKRLWASQCSGRSFRCMQHLKTVEIIGLVPDCTKAGLVIEFLKFLLKHASVLEKLSINTERCYQSKSVTTKDSLF